MRREYLAATLQPNTIKGRSVDVLFYSGATVPRIDWFTGSEYLLSFSMDPSSVRLGKLNSGAPVLDSHSSFSVEDVLGVVEKAWLTNEGAYATLRFSERDEVGGVWKDIQDGILNGISMGVTWKARDQKDVTEKGAKLKSFLVTAWEPFEISVLPRGADPQAGFLSASETPEWLTHLREIAEAGASRTSELAARIESLERRLCCLTNRTIK